jgi:Mrp family chromosome partitioning ATPase/uncharacterized protein involved in exopolysaccharide biosynthesis
MTRDHYQNEISLYQPQAQPYGYQPGMPYGAPGMAMEPESGDSIFELINDRLSGRWLWMVLVAIVLGGALGAAGWMTSAPVYESVGAIEIQPKVRVVLAGSDLTETDYFNQFVATQALLLGSYSTFDLALQNEDLASFEWTKEPDAIQTIEDKLNIEYNRNSQLIGISFTHPNPRVAQAVVNSVMTAYMDKHGNEELEEISESQQDLEKRLTGKKAEMNALREEQKQIRIKYNTADLRGLQDRLLDDVESYDDQIEAAELALDRHAAHLAARGSEAEAVETGPTLAQLEAIDEQLHILRVDRDNADIEFERIKARYRVNSAMYRMAERNYLDTQRLFERQYELALARWQELGPDALMDDADTDDFEDFYQGLPPERIEEELLVLRSKRDAKQAELRNVILDLQRTADLEYEQTQVQDAIDQTRDRIEELDINMPAIIERITIAQEGYLPTAPSGDSRKKKAVLGFGFGWIISFGAFFLLGSLDRRAYGTKQFRQGAQEDIAGLLGVLPDLGNSLRNPESSELAAHCVHQIRNQIEAVRDPRQGYVLSITSPFQGDGKTSIVMALGWSYAAAGFKTVVVDCDLVGRSLTRQLGLLGEVGLRESIEEGSLNGHLIQLPSSNLTALPCGINTRIGPESIRRTSLELLLNEIRKDFEIVIVDTGPLLGSLESTPVVIASDGVVLSMRRGRSRARLEEARTRLRSIGARCLGVILNYAVKSDCKAYVSEASLAAAEYHETDDDSVIRTPPGERNVLMLAMEHTSRGADSEDGEKKAAS